MNLKSTRVQENLRFAALLLATASIGVMSSCGFKDYKYPATTTSAGTAAPITYVLNASVQAAALNILSTSCESCHGTENMGGLNDITNPSHLESVGLIVPGNPGGSLLIQYVTNGVMPPTGPLAASDVATLTIWVQGTPNSATPTPSPTSSTGSTGGTGSLAQQVTTIFTNNCLSCHGTNGSGGLSNVTNLSGLVSGGWIVPNNTANSPLYSQVSAGSMPPSGSLAASDIQAIASWINAGAPAN